MEVFVYRNVFVLLLIFLGLTQPADSQKADFETAERFAPEKLREMVGDRTVNPNWLHDSDTFWYTYKTSDGTHYYIVDPDKRSKRPYLTGWLWHRNYQE